MPGQDQQYHREEFARALTCSVAKGARMLRAGRLRSLIRLVFALLVFLGLAHWRHELHATSRPVALEDSFAHPPDSARPWVFWIWLDGNVTSNGITADLEAMHRVGIGGVLIMEVTQGTPPGAIRFASPQWRALFRHTCAEAHRLGLQVNMNNDAGWCGSGGPWITPDLSMQKLVWTETRTQGPRRFEEKLDQPQTVRDFYRDVAVLAFPTLAADEIHMVNWTPTFTTSGSAADAGPPMQSASLGPFVLSRPTPGKPAWLQVAFDRPFTARELTLRMGLVGDQFCHGVLQASDDGEIFHDVSPFVAETRKMTCDFPAVTARYFRLVFPRLHPDLRNITISDLELSPRLRVPYMEGKGCFLHLESVPGPNQFPVRAYYPAVSDDLTIARPQVLNLTSRLGKDGQLQWDVPSGAWTVLRIGHTSTGVDNHPAPESGRGLECDKLRPEGVRAAFNGFLGKLIHDVPPLIPDTLASTHVDSWETGSQNWTENFRKEFRRRRGYDLLAFLPVLTGRVVDSLEISERFLWDFRQTIADLVADNYVGELERLAKRHRLRLSLEAYDAPCDDLTYAGRADEPMAEFWTWPPFEMNYTCAEMASAAHVYGKPIAGVEAFTATATERWLAHPFTAKPYADWAFCEGLNRLVIHRYAMQPWTSPNRLPGMSMGPFGLHYERTETWWENTRPWHEYLSRCQFLLRQGHYVADLCYLAPQDVPQHWRAPFELRNRVGYDFDVCPPEVVLNRMSVKRGRIFLPDGMNYRLLILPEVETMTPGLLQKLKVLTGAGATLVGRPPIKSPSLSDYPACDLMVARLVDELWGKDRSAAVGEHRFGKGKVIWGQTPEQVLAAQGVSRDFSPVTDPPSGGLRFIHRTLPGAEVYFVANLRLQPLEALCDFRAADGCPELWWPDTGRVEPVGLFERTEGHTRLPLRLDPGGSAFVIFRSGGKTEADPVVSIRRDGRVLVGCRQATPGASSTNRVSLAAAAFPADTDNSTFTMAVWAKPEVEIPLPVEANTGQAAYLVERNDALFPPPGHEVYQSPDHAGAGLSIGRNGVCVFEHAPFYFPPVLVWAAPLTNWTHIAVVYEQGKPKLYLNGRYAHEGRQSDYVVHSGVGVRHRRGTAPFQGTLGEFCGLPRALSAEEVAILMRDMPVPEISPPVSPVAVRPRKTGELLAQVWQSGTYVAETARGGQLQFRVADVSPPQPLTGSWELSFPPGCGAPVKVHLDRLVSWSDHPDAGVRHFSGTAAYLKSFTVSREMLRPAQSVYLDLGNVCIMARVKLNGSDLGLLWKPPFRVEVTQCLRPGENELCVEVVNLWVNRMIGDASLPSDSDRNPDSTLREWPVWLQAGRPSTAGRYTFTTWPLWKKDEPLRESGLIGPVQLLTAVQVPVSR
jgi:hypothetical protein